MAETTEPLILALDTATTCGSVAVTRGTRLLGEIFIDSDSTHSDRLLLQVEQLLHDLALSLAAIDALAVVDGPGSFTGLRVGIATAKGLATALNKPLFGVSTLEALAAALPQAALPVCPLLDARKGEVYVALYATSDGGPQLLVSPCVVPPEALPTLIAGPVLFVGSGAVAYNEQLRALYGCTARFAPWPLHAPRASWVAALVLPRLQAGEAPQAAELAPRYIRPPEAELPKPAR